MKTNLDIVIRRLHNEHLIGNPFNRPEDVVQWLGAVQAQDYAGAKWAVGQRVKNCLDTHVEQAYVKGKILRTHMMRPTWHFVAPDDIRWMQELTGPRVKAASAYYYRKFGLDDTTLKRSKAVFAGSLKDRGQLTRVDLANSLEEAGINANGLRLSYIIMYAELDGLICSGEPRGKQHTYALLDERAPSAAKLKRDEALAELTMRYFSSHGPALLEDFAWWSGLTMADAKAGVEMNKPELVNEILGERSYWFVSPTLTTRLVNSTVHLLPNYDEFLIAYKDHGPSFDKPLREGSATYKILSRHIIVLNGRVAGGWRCAAKKNQLSIEATLLVQLSRTQNEALRSAAERYGEFLGLSVTLRVRP